jgi:hypothetical protein
VIRAILEEQSRQQHDGIVVSGERLANLSRQLSAHDKRRARHQGLLAARVAKAILSGKENIQNDNIVDPKTPDLPSSMMIWDATSKKRGDSVVTVTAMSTDVSSEQPLVAESDEDEEEVDGSTSFLLLSQESSEKEKEEEDTVFLLDVPHTHFHSIFLSQSPVGADKNSSP